MNSLNKKPRALVKKRRHVYCLEEVVGVGALCGEMEQAQLSGNWFRLRPHCCSYIKYSQRPLWKSSIPSCGSCGFSAQCLSAHKSVRLSRKHKLYHTNSSFLGDKYITLEAVKFWCNIACV